MVSGVDWPGGDPFLQRQNEPSMAVSSRNPLHIMAGANDYRSVDLPGLPDKVTADGWVGLFKSFDGGRTWRSTLLPGFPQDTSPEGKASPLKGFAAAADPVMRAGANGLFYYSGIVFDRGSSGRSCLFVARFVDDNVEVPDPIRYLDTRIVDAGQPGQFIDKPWLAVDIPRDKSGKAAVGSQSSAAGNVYVSYSIVQGNPPNEHTKILFTRSTDGGLTWSRPIKLSESTARGQGTVIAVAPGGEVYVAWRLLEKTSSRQADSIMVAKSTDFGDSFKKTTEAIRILPYDQGTTAVSFRTTGYPAMAIDGTGRVYLAWSQYAAAGGTRVMLSSSKDGLTWTEPRMADPSTKGHQLMPALSFSAGRLVLLYYDLREDFTTGVFTPIPGSGGRYTEQRVPVGDLAGYPDANPPVPPNPANVFNAYVADAYPPDYVSPSKWRHTLDARVCFVVPADSPGCSSSARVTEYRIGSIPGSEVIEQLDYNPPNLPMFSKGTVPFMGDYIDLAAQTILPAPGGGWTFNTASSDTAVYHAVWTDSRNVQPPLDFDWTHYTPVESFYNTGTSKFDPSQTVPPCSEGQAGVRNQDIYTSRITQGAYVGSPANSKPLSPILKRAFVVFVENPFDSARTYDLKIDTPSLPGSVSFASFVEATEIRQITAMIAPYSSITRTVFVKASEPRARIPILVTDQVSGQQQTLILNPDPLNPDGPVSNQELFNPKIANPKIANPKIANPKIANPDLATVELSGPKIANPKIANTQLASPKIANPKIANPKIANPIIANPKIANPKIANMDITNPGLPNPKIANGSMTDLSWTITNQGNTAAAYNVKLLIGSPTVPSDFDFQLIINKLYATPEAKGCDLGVQKTEVLIANVIEPAFFTDPNQLVNPVGDATNSLLSNATLWLAPGEEAQVTLRTIGPTRDAVLNFLSTGITTAAVTQAPVTGTSQYGVSIAPFEVATQTELPSAVAGAGSYYTTTLIAVGASGPVIWSLAPGSQLPAGLSLSPNGVISGTPQVVGDFSFTVRAQSGSVISTNTLSILLSPPTASTPRLVFDIQPGSSQPGQPIAAPTGVRVKAVDANNAPLQGIEITISLGSNPSDGILSGTATAATDSSGLATFPFLQIDAAGTGYTLVASASGAVSVVSAAFNVSQAFLLYLQEPVGAPAGQPMIPAVQVWALDENFNPIVGATVTLTIGASGGGGVLSGGTAITDGYGIATFPNLSISEGGTGYTLVASVAGLTVTSSPFDIYDLAFERYPDGTAVCASCPVSNQFSARGVVIAPGAAPVLFDYAFQYGQPGMPTNHGVWPSAAGTFTMSFPGLPRGVSFEQRFSNVVSDPVPLLKAFDSNGSQIAASRITWTDLSTYTSSGGNAMRTVTTTITSMNGIARIEFTAGAPYFPIIDRVLLFAFGEAPDPTGDVITGDPDLIFATVAARRGNLEVSIRLQPGSFHTAGPNPTGLTLYLDTDRSALTGFPGLTTDAPIDTAAIGSEFVVPIPGSCGESTASLLLHLGPQYGQNGLPNASFFGVGAVPLNQFADGVDLIIPMADLGITDGRLNFKVTASKMVSASPCGYSGLLDALPNVGSVSGTVR
jgi:hypothetical protein